jgi:hypothetical protein
MNRWGVLYAASMLFMAGVAAYGWGYGRTPRTISSQINIVVKPTCSEGQFLQWDGQRGLICMDDGTFITVPEGAYTFETWKEALEAARAEGWAAACRKYGGVPSVCESTAKDYAERKAGEK